MSTAFVIIALVLALAATVLAFVFIVPDKKRSTLNKPLQIVHDLLNFKFLIIEKIMQALYIFSTAFVILFGVLSLFQVTKVYEGSYIDPNTFEYVNDYSYEWQGGYGLLLIILGPIAVRLSYELIMMAILLVKNVIRINNKLKDQNESDSASAFDIPAMPFPKKPEQPAQTVEQTATPVAPAVNDQPKFCMVCGTPTVNGQCPNGHM